MNEKRKEEVNGTRPKRRRRRRELPITRADVTRFLESPVARRYYAFSESNVKRQLVRMLLFLSNEVERLESKRDSWRGAGKTETPWIDRVG